MRAPKPRRWIVNPAGSVERTPPDPDAATGGGADATDPRPAPATPRQPPRTVERLRMRTADGAGICQRGMRRRSGRAPTRDAPVVLVGADAVHDRRHRGLPCAARAGVALERPAVDAPAAPPARRQLRSKQKPRASLAGSTDATSNFLIVEMRMRKQSETAFSHIICAQFAQKARLVITLGASDGNGGYAPCVPLAPADRARALLLPRPLSSSFPPLSSSSSSASSHRAAPSPRSTGATLFAM